MTRDPRRGLRRVPARRRSRRRARPAARASRTWSSCAPSARSTASPASACGYALCSPKFRAAVDAVRQPFSVNSLAQAAAAEAIRHPTTSRTRVERTIVERASRGGGDRASSASRPPTSQANFSWIDLGDRDEAEVVERARRGGRDRAPGRGARRPRPHPGHLRHPHGERALPRGARPRSDRPPATQKAVQFAYSPRRGTKSEMDPASTPAPTTAAPTARRRTPGPFITGDLARRPAWPTSAHLAGETHRTPYCGPTPTL